MIETIVRVARGEGLGSVMSRSAERMREAWERRARLVAGTFAPRTAAPIVNVLTRPPARRLGGVPIQLRARLAEERQLRDVTLFYPGMLESNGRAWTTHSLDASGVRALVVEGAFESWPLLPARELNLILAVHDYSLFSASPHYVETNAALEARAAQLLGRARAVIFPSEFLRAEYLARFGDLPAQVIEPGAAEDSLRVEPVRNRVAFVGSVKPHKGGAMIPEVIRAVEGVEWHVFGGGDLELLRAIRGLPHVTVHGYYGVEALPRLLARHHIGLAVLPSIAPETFGLTLSECWRAGVPAVALDHGALGDRIRVRGGGLLAPPAAGAAGMAARIRDWLDGAEAPVPSHIPSAREAAVAHVALYRQLGVLD
jgi:glycosyltransferase involved in cell wall biosynthesis